MLAYALPFERGFSGNIPFTNVRWEDFIKYTTWKNMLRYGAMPWDISLKEAEASRLGAQTRLLGEQAWLTSAQRYAIPAEEEYTRARAKYYLSQIPKEIDPSLVAELFKYLNIGSFMGLGIDLFPNLGHSALGNFDYLDKISELYGK